MKKMTMFALTLAAVALSGGFGIQHASALEFTTDITNKSGASAIVEVYAKGVSGSASLYSNLAISNKDTKSTTFLGLTNLCPSYLTGKVGNAPITPMTCSGDESGSTSTRCCGNLKFNVLKKNGAYHFEKIQ